MKTSPGIRMATATAVAVLALSGCAAGGGGAHHPSSPEHSMPSSPASSGSAAHGHAMDGGPVPEGIEKAADPRFPVGAKVTLEANHMPGMKNAPATISGAFTTTAYAVDYTPTDGGPEVEDHKWVVQEELRDSGDQQLEAGDTAVMTADHMPGMKGATAKIARVWTGTVYMVDYQADGMTMKNHKWVAEEELRPAN
ncbi:YdhK family protein [Micrococcaceae bacterium RIT802]|nr:YdhK family protein [Micrococcaceae bacterium RIT 802]